MKIKKIRLFTCLTLAGLCLIHAGAAFGGLIGKFEAEKIAASWIEERFESRVDTASSSLDTVLAASELQRDGRTFAYSFEIPGGGFVLVSARGPDGRVIAFSEENAFNPYIPAVSEFLDAVSLSDGREHRTTGFETSSHRNPVGVIGPLLTTQWDQMEPYNDLAPVAHSGGSSRKAPVGCVAVAIGQVMRHHRFPPRGYGTNEYQWANGAGDVLTLFADFNFPYAWHNMPDSLDANSSELEIFAVAKLLYHLGVAVEMQYGYNESGAFSADVADAIMRHFGYRHTAEYMGRDNSTDRWYTILRDELLSGKPVYYAGSGPGNHAFVLDGLDDSMIGMDREILVHLNYGWGGDSDGWYDIDFFHLFTTNHRAIIGVSPSLRIRDGIEPDAPDGTSAPALRSSGCFVATAAFGSYEADEVLALRTFRDGFLSNSEAGRSFVRLYYAAGPALAEYTGRNSLLGVIARLHLMPAARLAALLAG